MAQKSIKEKRKEKKNELINENERSSKQNSSARFQTSLLNMGSSILSFLRREMLGFGPIK